MPRATVSAYTLLIVFDVLDADVGDDVDADVEVVRGREHVGVVALLVPRRREGGQTIIQRTCPERKTL